MKVAKSYVNYIYDETKAYENSKGKLVVDAKCRCNRCNGSGIAISHIENGQPIPYVNDNGICYTCKGIGYFYKTIRLYTDEEFAKMEVQNQKNQEKKEAERQERMIAEYADKKTAWLKKYNCNEESVFIYFPSDSYDVKETLKNAGFTFVPELLWHCATIPAGYEDKVVEVSLSSIVTFSAWGSGYFNTDSRDLVNEAIQSKRPQSPSNYIAEVGKRVRNIPVTLTSVRGFEGMYGYSQIVRFEDEAGNIVKWFTATELSFEPGDKVFLTGTVKKCDIDKYEDGAKVTILTRCKLEEVIEK